MKMNEPAVCKIRKVEVFEAPFVAKVAISGDWHISPIVSERQLQMLLEAFVKIQPELIILQGDLMDSPEQFQNPESVEKLRQWFLACREFAPTVMVLGSHDYIEPKRKGQIALEALESWQKICRETGVELLNDAWFETKNVRVFGMFQSPEYCLDAKGKHHNNPKVFEERLRTLEELIRDGISEEKVNWFVAHAPDMTRQAELMLADKFDVASFGHTHGGCLPLGLDTVVDKVGGHGGIVSPTKRPLPSKVRGVMRERELVKIINTGMVATQYCAPRFTQYLNFAKAAEVTEVLVGKQWIF